MGLCLVVAWSVLGLHELAPAALALSGCLVCDWSMLGLCVCWDLSGVCLGYVWGLFGCLYGAYVGCCLGVYVVVYVGVCLGAPWGSQNERFTAAWRRFRRNLS